MLVVCAVAALGVAPAAAASTKPPERVATASTTTAGATAGVGPASAAAIRSWLRLHESVFVGLQIDLETVAAAGHNGSLTSVAAGCDQLAADTTTIEGVAPIPVARIEGQWRAALDDFSRAATDCVEGVTRNDARQSDRYRPEITAAITQVDAVVRELTKGKQSGDG